jgi:hypothetical protein
MPFAFPAVLLFKTFGKFLRKAEVGTKFKIFGRQYPKGESACCYL